MKIKAVEVHSGDTFIGKGYSALVLNVRRLIVCGTPQIVHIVLDNAEDTNPGGLLYGADDEVEIVGRLSN